MQTQKRMITLQKNTQKNEAGQGFYLGGQFGVGISFWNTNTIVLSSSRGQTSKSEETTSFRLPFPSAHFMMGYNFRAGNLVVGPDLRLSLGHITPGINLGFIASDRHLFGINLGLNLMPKIILDSISENIKKSKDRYASFSEDDEARNMFADNIDKNDVGLGFGGAVMYRYYTNTKSFHGVEFRIHKYSFGKPYVLDPAITYTYGAEF